ncbi:NADH-quinone oxidoreductase subunit C [Ornithinicoccus halotolerans]|uniref:NADH-quinone oxidoreductase subunit C n=1 Tax=Ornithinicoccus halotolerans TaxID=1748220 RepID=UPI001297C512|nr:NADH-quinone oxidoreductase subunit C [Ornithinicoccus halotolerans]
MADEKDTRDQEHQPARTDEQKVDTTHAQETGAASVSAEAALPDTGAARFDTEPRRVGERRGMFGTSSGNDTSGYGGLRQPILFPGTSPRPYGGYFDAVVDALAEATGEVFEAAVASVVVDRGELTLHVRREHLPTVARALRDDAALRFEMCTGVSGVHFPDHAGAELHAVYHFQSITHSPRRVRIEVTCPEEDPHIPSIVGTYPGNDWHERETWDMFGIIFDDHPALTRILMPDDWPGHPQRKDYPLGGIPVEYKGATIPAPDERRSYN